MLLTGMSDGGTFCYVSGLESASPFTHLAPVSATFHPLMAEMADAERLRGLPIYLVHGRLDWMFPVQVARQTLRLLSAAGADVTYREIDDLSHTLSARDERGDAGLAGRRTMTLNHAAIGAQHLAVDPGAIGAGEEGDDGGDVLGRAEALQRVRAWPGGRSAPAACRRGTDRWRSAPARRR